MRDNLRYLIVDFKSAMPEMPQEDILEFAGMLCDERLKIIETDYFKIENNDGIGVNLFDGLKRIISLLVKSEIVVFHDMKDMNQKILTKKFPLEYKARVTINTAKHLPKDTKFKKVSILDQHIKNDIIFFPGNTSLDEVFRIRNLLKFFGTTKTLTRSQSKEISLVLTDLSKEDGSEIAKSFGFEYKDGFYRKSILECDLTTFEKECNNTGLFFKIL